ncbi:predicted protein [Postia placenta Mad-698-R]|uniref:Uncharacterized protein n=1 Tax=Postia placenta MAD-698-R-SB12 TaxID=670580 RepID=A0A1X6MR96_9APHY|nr:hypothetical protein POSPLADRAFT_1151926 [Postia placenta MAD-698-R-SB12]EED82185.1 predicted protein [Postia placenta Mad-698-R]OSX58925.1 hypothetical protein POSPLADRAFT_1151926 [Postia placenta MAD-698-R-SB12]
MAYMVYGTVPGFCLNLGLDESEWAMGNGSVGASHQLLRFRSLSLASLGEVPAPLWGCADPGDAGLYGPSGPWLLAQVVYFLVILCMVSKVLARLGLRRATTLVLRAGLLSGTTSLSVLGMICVPSMVLDLSLLVSLVWVGVHVSVSGTRGSGTSNPWVCSLVFWFLVLCVGGASTVGLVKTSRPQSMQQRGLGRLVFWMCGPVSVFWINAMLRYSWSRSIGRRRSASGSLDPWMHLALSPSELGRLGREGLWQQLARVAGYGKKTTFIARLVVLWVVNFTNIFWLVVLFDGGFIPWGAVYIPWYMGYGFASSSVVYTGLWAGEKSSDDESGWSSESDWSCGSESEDEDNLNSPRTSTPHKGKQPASIGWAYASGTSEGAVGAEASGSGLNYVDKLDAVDHKSAVNKAADATADDDGSIAVHAPSVAVVVGARVTKLKEALAAAHRQHDCNTALIEEREARNRKLVEHLPAIRQAAAQAEEKASAARQDGNEKSRRVQELEAHIAVIKAAQKEAVQRSQKEKAALEASLDILRRKGEDRVRALKATVECARKASGNKSRGVEELEARLKQAESERDSTHERLQREKEALQTEAKLAREELVEKEHAEQQLDRVIERLREDIARTRRERDTEIAGLLDQEKALKADLDDRSSQLEITRAALRSAEEDLKKSKALCADLEQSVSQDRADKEALEVSLREAKAELEAIATTRRAKAVEVLGLMRSRKELAEQMDAIKGSAEFQRVEAHFAQQAFEEKVKDLEIKLAASTGQTEQLNADLKKVRELRSKNAVCKQEINAAKEHNAELERRNAELEAHAACLEEKRTHLQELDPGVKAEKAKLEIQRAQLDNDKRKAEEDFSAKVVDNRRKICDLRESNADLRAELAEARANAQVHLQELQEQLPQMMDDIVAAQCEELQRDEEDILVEHADSALVDLCDGADMEAADDSDALWYDISATMVFNFTADDVETSEPEEGDSVELEDVVLDDTGAGLSSTKQFKKKPRKLNDPYCAGGPEVGYEETYAISGRANVAYARRLIVIHRGQGVVRRSPYCRQRQSFSMKRLFSPTFGERLHLTMESPTLRRHTKPFVKALDLLAWLGLLSQARRNPNLLIITGPGALVAIEHQPNLYRLYTVVAALTFYPQP